MKNKSLQLILGISLLLGTLSAILFKETHFYRSSGNGLVEISGKEYGASYDSEYVSKKKVYNYQLGILVFTISIGACLIGFNWKKRE